MNNNVIDLRSYNHTVIHTKHSKRYRNSETLRCWMVAIADTFATLSIGCCTIFCMYLAYTML